MKSITNYTGNLIAPICIIMCCSCNHYLEKGWINRETRINGGYIHYFPDSNFLYFKSKIGIRADTQSAEAETFSTPVVNHLKWYDFFAPTEFYFYYDKQQLVAINVNVFSPKLPLDTSFVPSIQQVDQSIGHNGIITNSKYHLGNIDYRKGRKNIMIAKGNATILLYNIKPKSYDKFYRYFSQFKFE